MKFNLNILVICLIGGKLFSAARRTVQRSHSSHTITRINAAENCHDRPLRPNHFTNTEIFLLDKNVYAVNGEGVCENPTRSLEMVIINVTKCAERTKSDCEHVRRIEWKPGLVICPFLGTPTPWTSALNAFKPPLSCINQQGKFSVRNLTLDGDALSNVFLTKEDFYWITQWEFFDENLSPWSCFRTEIDFPKVRH